MLIQKQHPYTENLNRETAEDSKNTFLHCGDALVAFSTDSGGRMNLDQPISELAHFSNDL
jgi:hypothetical protein